MLQQIGLFVCSEDIFEEGLSFGFSLAFRFGSDIESYPSTTPCMTFLIAHTSISTKTALNGTLRLLSLVVSHYILPFDPTTFCEESTSINTTLGY